MTPPPPESQQPRLSEMRHGQGQGGPGLPKDTREAREEQGFGGTRLCPFLRTALSSRPVLTPALRAGPLQLPTSSGSSGSGEQAGRAARSRGLFPSFPEVWGPSSHSSVELGGCGCGHKPPG